MSKREKIISVILWLVSALWIAFIFANSLQTGTESGQMSGSVTDTINSLLGAIHPSLHVSHLFVRKAAHFCEFAMLALVLCFAVRSVTRKNDAKKNNIFWIFTALLCSVITGAIDETIQLFVDGRGGSVIDVFIDSAGAACTTLAFFFVLWLVKREKKTNE